MAKGRILVVEDDVFLIRLLKDYLSKKGYQVDAVNDGESALAQAKAAVPDLVLSDVTMPGMDGYELCRKLRQYPPTARVPIILLTALGEISNKVTGFETGADDYVTKPFDLTELELRIRVLLARTAAVVAEKLPAPKGRVITVFSPRGGVGRTTLAVNLAVSLAQLWKLPVPLLDLALNVGHVSLLMNLRPQTTILNLARSPDAVEDIDAVKMALSPTASGVQVLAAPAEAGGADLVSPDLVVALVKSLREAFEHIVIDTEPTFSDVNLAALDNSDLVVLLLAREMASVLSARMALDVFKELKYPPEKIVVVINGIIRRPTLPKENIEGALGYPVALTIPHDPDILVRAIDQGMPAVLLDPNAPAPATMEILAYHLSRTGMEERMAGEPSESLLRVKKRLDSIHK